MALLPAKKQSKLPEQVEANPTNLISNLKKYKLLIMFLICISLICTYFLFSSKLGVELSNIILGISCSLFASVLISFTFADIDRQYLHSFQTHIKEYVSASNASIVPVAKFHEIKAPLDPIRNALNATKNPHFTISGIHLRSLRSLIEELLQRKDCTIHLLIPNPASDGLTYICKRENRNIDDVKAEIIALTNELKSLSKRAKFEIRWTDQPSEVTILRVGDRIFWRPRFSSDSDNNGDFCIEHYQPHGERVFGILKRELGASWDLAKVQ